MNKTLMQGLNEKDMQGVINTYDLKPFYFPTLFPLKPNNTLSWKALTAQAGLKIAADVVSRNASIPRKIREAISRIQGDIPKIAVAREMDEIQLNEYDIAVALASGQQDLMALVEFWAEDMGFCWQAVASRIEWIASSPPVPARISRKTFFSSLGSFGVRNSLARASRSCTCCLSCSLSSANNCFMSAPAVTSWSMAETSSSCFLASQ